MIGHIKRERRSQKRENGDIKKERDREVLIEQHGRKQFERKKERTNTQMQKEGITGAWHPWNWGSSPQGKLEGITDWLIP